jgi:hypothetical protein
MTGTENFLVGQGKKFEISGVFNLGLEAFPLDAGLGPATAFGTAETGPDLLAQRRFCHLLKAIDRLHPQALHDLSFRQTQDAGLEAAFTKNTGADNKELRNFI